MSDGDGFSGPDPAPKPDPPDSDAPEPDGDMESALAYVGEDVSCENCAHHDVCAYYAGVKPMLEDPQTGQGDPPFDAADLAAICNFFEYEE